MKIKRITTDPSVFFLLYDDCMLLFCKIAFATSHFNRRNPCGQKLSQILAKIAKIYERKLFLFYFA